MRLRTCLTWQPRLETQSHPNDHILGWTLTTTPCWCGRRTSQLAHWRARSSPQKRNSTTATLPSGRFRLALFRRLSAIRSCFPLPAIERPLASHTMPLSPSMPPGDASSSQAGIPLLSCCSRSWVSSSFVVGVFLAFHHLWNYHHTHIPIIRLLGNIVKRLIV